MTWQSVVKHFSVRTRLKANTARCAAAALLLALLPTVTQAGEITLTCTPPTMNEDGTTLTDLAGYRFYQSSTSGGPYTLIRDEPDETNCGHVITDVADGTYYFVATAYNVPGVESAYSGEASKTVTTVPNPPGGLVASGNLVAYTIQQSPDVLLTYPIGTVMAGVWCDPDQSANGMYRVNIEDVTMPAGVEARVAFAECAQL